MAESFMVALQVPTPACPASSPVTIKSRWGNSLFCNFDFCIFLLACAAEFRDQLERSLSLRQPPPGSAFARDTARSRSLGRPGGASGLASVLGIQDDLVEVLRDSVAVLGDSVEVFGIRWRSQLFVNWALSLLILKAIPWENPWVQGH